MRKKKTAPRAPVCGRPSLGDAPLTARLGLRCTPAEKRAWTLKAALAGIDLTTWIREICNAAK